MAHCGGGIDELEGDNFLGGTVGDGVERLTEGNDSLANTGARSANHDVILVNDTIVRVSAERSDLLRGKIELSLDVSILSDLVDLLVDLGSVMVSVLTGTGDAEANARWMPGTDTGDLTETLVGLTGKAGGSPTGGDTFVTLTLGGGKGVDQLVLAEDGVDSDLLLKERLGELNLVGRGSSVDLDLHNVSSLLSKLNETDLGMSDNTDDRAIFSDLLEFSIDALFTVVGSVLLGVLGEGLLLGAIPVLVEASKELLAQVLSPHGGKGTESGGSVNVANNTNDEHGRSLKDSYGLYDFLLVELSSRALDLTDDLVHASLVSHEGSKMRWESSVVARELSD